MMRAARSGRGFPVVAVLALVLLGAAGCGGGGRSPADNSGDVLVLTSISPATGTPLAAGSTVTFQGKLDYSLNSITNGYVLMVLEDQTGRILTTGQTAVATGDRQGSVSLSNDLAVPATGVTEVKVLFILTDAAFFPTQAGLMVSYPVR